MPDMRGSQPPAMIPARIKSGGVCVSSVSIVCTYLAQFRIPPEPLLRGVPTVLTVLTVSSTLVLTLIILVPIRPSRHNSEPKDS
jgi:hypothetical protein